MTGRARGASPIRRLRGMGGRLIRRAGLLPAGMADGLGEDDELLGSSLPHTVMVFFADPPGSLYQLEQWYGALRALDRRHRVVIVLQDSRVARAVRQDSGLDVIVVARYTTMDDLLSRSDVAVALYVNHHPENFSNLRFASMVHASLLHGDGDKAVTVSNLIKAYDVALVAGQAAVDRAAAFCTFYDAATRCIPIGRPPLDGHLSRVVGPRHRLAGEPPTVLYAPTWEGSAPSVGYGSLVTHGPALVETLLTAGWDVSYRPHPLTGSRDRSHAVADREIRARLSRAAKTGGHHRTDTGPDLQAAFAGADLLVCDISSVAVDWLVVDRPLLITAPARPEAVIARTPLTALAPAVAADDLRALPALALEQLERDPLRDRRRQLVEYYLGDVRDGAATARFLAAVDRLLDIRDSERVRLAGRRVGRG